MVFNKIKEVLNPTDDKYEVLYYKYSQVKLENQKLKQKHHEEMGDYKHKLQKKIAERLIGVYEAIEETKNDSFKVKGADKDVQRLLLGVNKSEKAIKDTMKDMSIEEVVAKDKMYDPELHEVASYEDAKGMTKGMILKTVKKGFKFKGETVKKPRVVVTK